MEDNHDQLGTHSSNRRAWWMLVVALAFAVVYAASLTFVYIEGDDGSSIAYHALGRQPDLQLPYSAYHSGMDVLLRWLPTDETTLRVAAMSLSAVAACLMVILTLKLVFDRLRIESTRQTTLAALAVLIACPEFFYLGLVYTPTVVAMCFVTTAHLILRSVLARHSSTGKLDTQSLLRIAAAAGLFGFGASCRWDIMLYGLIVVADLYFPPLPTANSQGWTFGKRAAVAVGWGLASIGCWFLFISLSGYGLSTIFNLGKFTAQLSGDRSFNLQLIVRMGVAYHTAFTPALLVFGAVGLLNIRGSNRRFAIVGIVLMLFAIIGMKCIIPKMVVVFLPAAAVPIVAGFLHLWFQIEDSSWRRIVRLTVVALLLAPWLIGLRVTDGKTAWGPSFELQAYDEIIPEKTFNIAIGNGAAFPTSEGPRALFGHAAALLGGSWRDLNRQLEQERVDALQYAIHQQIPFLIVQGSNGYFVSELSRLGFQTRHGEAHRATETLAEVRQFSSPDGRQLLLIKLAAPLPDFVSDPVHANNVATVAGEWVVVQGYPATLRALYQTAPEAMQKLGPTTAILHLSQFREKIETASGRNRS